MSQLCDAVVAHLLRKRYTLTKHNLYFFLFISFSIGLFSIAQNAALADCTPQGNLPVCLSGVAIAADYAGALITQPGKTGMRRVRAGDTVEDWTVGEIGPRYVVFTRGEQSVRISLAKDEPESASPEAQPAKEPTRAVKKGPVRHVRSLARGGE
jgi:hypothetical protein